MRPGKRLTPLRRNLRADDPEKINCAFFLSINNCAASNNSGTFCASSIKT
jgi:hypothetical protein